MTDAQQRRDTRAKLRDALDRRDRLWTRMLARALLVGVALGLAAIVILARDGTRWSIVTAALVATVPASLALLGGVGIKERATVPVRLWLATFAIGLVALGTIDLARDYAALRRSEACLRLAAVTFAKQPAGGSVTCRYAATGAERR